MKGLLKGLVTTVKTTFRKPVTVQYPDEHLPLSPRYMGFPALIWDKKVDEPACTGCMVCMRNCPTECITVTMKDNPRHAEGTSTRRKIVDDFSINYARCILCQICVEVCNFDAIVMTDLHEAAVGVRSDLKADMKRLFEIGREYQDRKGIVVGSSGGEEEPKS